MTTPTPTLNPFAEIWAMPSVRATVRSADAKFLYFNTPSTSIIPVYVQQTMVAAPMVTAPIERMATKTQANYILTFEVVIAVGIAFILAGIRRRKRK